MALVGEIVNRQDNFGSDFRIYFFNQTGNDCCMPIMEMGDVAWKAPYILQGRYTIIEKAVDIVGASVDAPSSKNSLGSWDSMKMTGIVSTNPCHKVLTLWRRQTQRGNGIQKTFN